MRALAVACLSFLSATTAAGQQMAPAGRPDPVEVRNLSVAYELTNADSTLRCPITLEPKPVGRGLALVFDRAVCTPRFGFLGEVSAWLPGIAGAILLIAPDGRIVTEFTEGVGGVYEAIREGDGVYFFANLQFVDPSARVQTADLVGTWVLALTEPVKPGAKDTGPRQCSLLFTEEVAGDQLFHLRLLPECDPALVQTGFQAWQLERGDIVLRMKNGDGLRFEKSEGNIWSKVPEKPRPMTLSRP
jgi:hypothetical protein